LSQKRTVFEIFDFKNAVTLKTGLGVRQLTFNIVSIGLSRTVSEINGDFRRKSPIFPHPMYLTPLLKGFPWNRVSAHGSKETRMMALPDGRKGFKICFAIDTMTTCDIQPPRYASVARVKIYQPNTLSTVEADISVR